MVDETRARADSTTDVRPLIPYSSSGTMTACIILHQTILPSRQYRTVPPVKETLYLAPDDSPIPALITNKKLE